MKTVLTVAVISTFVVCGFLLWAAMTIHGVYKDADE